VTTETKQTSVHLRARLAQLRHLIASFRKNKRGNVALMVGMMMLPIVGVIGCVVDYSMATSVRAKLQASADAATLAAVSVNSPVVANAKAMNSSNGPVLNGTTYLANLFTSNRPASPSASIQTSAVNKSGMIVTASMSFSSQVPTAFLGVLGFRNITVTGSSTSSYTMPTYIDFYLMLDVSGSMSFPSTVDEQLRLQAVNPDNLNGPYGYPGGCTFACHFTRQGACAQTANSYNWQGPIPAAGTTTNPGSGGYCQGFIISRLGTTPVAITSGNNTSNGNKVNWTNTQVSNCPSPGTTSCIQLRADAVGYAVNQLLATAVATEQATGINNQFRVGLYPFIVDLYSYFALTSSINGSASSPGTINYAAANLAQLLDTGANASLGSGGTHFENALSSMNSLITSVGNGTSATNTLPYVFLVTDGSQDCQTQSGGSWSGTGTRCSPYYNSATTLDSSLCTTLKNRGITVAVLYIPYQQIQNATTFANSEDVYANNNIPNIPPALRSCASPNFYYTANTPADINDALVKMFEQAVKTAHVTN